MGTGTNTARESAPAARGDRTSEVVPSTGDMLTTSTLTAWAWVRLGEQHNIALTEICDAAGVSEGELRDPGGYLSQRAANRVAELAFERVGPHAAMLAAQLLDRGHFALPELVVRSAPTVGDGVPRACEVFPLLHRGSQLVHEMLPDRAIMRWQCPPELVVHPAYVELVFAIVVQGIRRETGHADTEAAATWFEHDGPPTPTEHERVLGPVRFAAPETRLELSAATLALPLLRASASAHQSAVSVANEALRGVTNAPLRVTNAASRRRS
ncbi:MAG TPA: AraC family transcriptional regulator ligand-binding domain-containing protein [Polyangiales bacterium]|nr:AraC family transcriptional regulator ligand-binding domain-containing protein [Polyangiales bacterium]